MGGEDRQTLPVRLLVEGEPSEEEVTLGQGPRVSGPDSGSQVLAGSTITEITGWGGTFMFRCRVHPESDPLVKGKAGACVSSRLPRRISCGGHMNHSGEAWVQPPPPLSTLWGGGGWRGTWVGRARAGRALRELPPQTWGLSTSLFHQPVFPRRVGGLSSPGWTWEAP